jgi:Tfp pilus assembly protein PilV
MTVKFKSGSFNDNSESGAGLVEVLVALALLALGSVLLMKMMNTVSKTRRAVELKAEATLLKKNLLSSTNCKVIPGCQGDELRPLTDYDGRVLVAADGSTRFGSWTVQARCQPDQSLDVRVALLDAKGQAVKDPLRGKLMDWQAPEGILIEPGILCGIVSNAVSPSFTVRLGLKCENTQGTCAPPPESTPDPNAPARMCCDDGRDAAKPLCPAPLQELASYWDRQDDWGSAGQWVVLCQ